MARSWDGGPHPNEADVRESSSMLPCLDGGECQGPEKRSARRIGRQRAATRMRPRLLVQQRWLAQIDSFFFARQRALQAPPMDLDAKPCLDLLETLRGCQLWPCGLEIDHEGDNLDRDLVPILGTALARQQARQPGLLKRPQGLVESRRGAVTWAMRQRSVPLPAHRTGWAVFPRPALGQGIRPSPSGGYEPASTV